MQHIVVNIINNKYAMDTHYTTVTSWNDTILIVYPLSCSLLYVDALKHQMAILRQLILAVLSETFQFTTSFINILESQIHLMIISVTLWFKKLKKVFCEPKLKVFCEPKHLL